MTYFFSWIMKDDKYMYKEALERFLKLYDLYLRVDHECWYYIIMDEDGYTVRDSNRKTMAWIINGFIAANNIDIYNYILTKLYGKTISYRGNDFYRTNQRFITVPSSYYELMIYLDLKGA